MRTLSRRTFVQTLAVTAACSAAPRAFSAPTPRRFTLDLTPGAIGVSGDLLEMIRLAHTHGFESVQPDGGYLARQDAAGRERVMAALTGAGLKWGSAGLPVEFRRSDEAFRKDIANLPQIAAALKATGATRVGTWIMPAHNDLDYPANLKLHAARLGEVARILKDHDLRLGLEYVGTPTIRTRFKHAFVYRLAQAKELIDAIGVSNTGLVLDSWHWWTAGDSAADLRALANREVVAVDLNDAPAGIPLEAQQDNQRELPMATGVIPVKDFLEALLSFNYDGPVRAEPFNQALNALDNDAACAKTIEALKKAARLVAA